MSDARPQSTTADRQTTAPPLRAPAAAGPGGPPLDLRPARPAPWRALVDVLYRALVQAGEMLQLTGVVLSSAVRNPVGYWGDVRDQMSAILRTCWLPMLVSTFAFGLAAPGLQGANLFSLFGIPERLGGFFVMASVREFAPWINAMVVAGVVGTAITADLGARTIREEIDAMRVLGVEPIRSLVVPRVIALTFMTGLLDLAALVFGTVGGYAAAVPFAGATPAAFIESFWSQASTTDLWGSVVKTAIFGLIIGIVCCYKGLKAEGGPAGVGRAVNQAVVIAFAAIWIFNYVFTSFLLGLNPEIQVFK